MIASTSKFRKSATLKAITKQKNQIGLVKSVVYGRICYHTFIGLRLYFHTFINGSTRVQANPRFFSLKKANLIYGSTVTLQKTKIID